MKRLLVVVLALATVLCTAQIAMARQTIKAGDFGGDKFRPRNSRVAKGERVTWRNIEHVDEDHTITAIGNNWSFNVRLGEQEKTKYRFFQAGTYLFRCRIHSTLVHGDCEGMCGKIVVG